MEKVIVLGYEVSLVYDREDRIYIAEAKALPGCMAHGSTQEEAAREVAVAISLHVETARDLGQTVQAPMRMYGAASAV